MTEPDTRAYAGLCSHGRVVAGIALAAGNDSVTFWLNEMTQDGLTVQLRDSVKISFCAECRGMVRAPGTAPVVDHSLGEERTGIQAADSRSGVRVSLDPRDALTVGIVSQESDKSTPRNDGLLSDKAIELRDAIVNAWLPGKTPFGMKPENHYMTFNVIPGLRRDAELALIVLAERGLL